ncbi:7905_t:CDS:2 [Gigaspora rosea]|nr:7905_t:CDS:2 [Gigaspora rosea]
MTVVLRILKHKHISDIDGLASLYYLNRNYYYFGDIPDNFLATATSMTQHGLIEIFLLFKDYNDSTWFI